MQKLSSKRKYNIGELVSAAYEEAERVTSNRCVAAIIVSRTLESWLARSDRPELVRELRAAAPRLIAAGSPRPALPRSSHAAAAA
jgi:hypothetical protein